MAQNYGFPMLSADECVSFFRESITTTVISEEDFKKPEARRWQVFFGTIFELMSGHPADQIEQTRLHAVSDCEYSELHEESFTFMAYAMSFQKIMSVAGISDFTVRDLLDPKPKRLIRIVSAAANFIRFGSIREEVFNGKKEELEKQRESYDLVIKEDVELKKVLHAKRETHATHIQKMKQLQEENDAITNRIQDQHKQREVHQRKLTEMKNEFAQRKAANDQIKVNILSTQAEGEKLSQRIVQSPERVKAEQDRAKNRILALKSTIDERQTRLDELQRQKEAVTTQQQNIETAMRLLKDLGNCIDRRGELEKAIRQQQDKDQNLHSSSLGASARLDNMRQVMATRQEKLSKLDLMYHKKKASIQEEISQLVNLKETVQNPMGSNELEIVREKKAIQEDIELKEGDMETKVKQVENLYFQILQKVDKLNTDVANGFGKFRNIMKGSTQQ